MRVRTLFWIGSWLLFLAVLGVLLGLRSYQVFAREHLVAIVQCDPVPPGSPHQFLLRMTFERGKPDDVPQEFPMVGDQWTIGGDILKWHPWLNLLGIKNCYKLTRLSSRYLKASDEISQPRSVIDLEGGTTLLWRVLYRWGRWIPFVEAVYGNETYVMAQPGSRWGIYVTLSGYLIKPLHA